MDWDPQFDALMLLFLILSSEAAPPPLKGATVNGSTGPQDFRHTNTPDKNPTSTLSDPVGCRRQLSVVLLSFFPSFLLFLYNGEVCVPPPRRGGVSFPVCILARGEKTEFTVV